MTNEIRSSLISSGRMAVLAFLFFCLGQELTSGQQTGALLMDTKNQGEWWYPLLKKHNIDPAQFKFGSNLKPASDDPKGFTALELGNDASVVDSTRTIKDPVFIIKEEGEYSIVRAISATHSLKNGQIHFDKGNLESYKLNSNENQQVRTMTFQELQFDTKTRRATIKEVMGKVAPFKSSPKTSN